MTKKPNGYWTEEIIKNSLTGVIEQIGHFPTKLELININRNDIIGACCKYGGLTNFRILLGYKRQQKPRKYWNDEIIIKKLKELINILGHFPIHDEINLYNYIGLSATIQRHGGLNKYRKLLNYECEKVPNGYWTDETIIQNLNKIIFKIDKFPDNEYLMSINRWDLRTAIIRNGGFNKFTKLIGYDVLRKPVGYWTDETIETELTPIFNKIGHFPTQNELSKIGRTDLMNAIKINGGLYKFYDKFGCSCVSKPDGYWTDEILIEELNKIISEIGYFPTKMKLIELDKGYLCSAISQNGGINKFRILLGYKLSQKPDGYWTKENTIRELNQLIQNIGHFPTSMEVQRLNGGLVSGISSNGGFSATRKELGYDELYKPYGYWTDETIINELKNIIMTLNRFPTVDDLHIIEQGNMISAIHKAGGFLKFRKILGYSTEFDDYISQLMSYCTRRGKNSENIVYNIITEYCKLNGLSLPTKNVKLSKGNVIEFVCNLNKKIGIDVTNTKSERCVSHKWTKKDYYKHLDELWIVVFSNIFVESDYIRWNNESPSNVYIYNINDFCKELQYDLDEATKNTIENYKSCTFHTRDKFKEQSLNT